MIKCTTLDVAPSPICYEICVLAYKCGALKAWEREHGYENFVPKTTEGQMLWM